MVELFAEEVGEVEAPAGLVVRGGVWVVLELLEEGVAVFVG